MLRILGHSVIKLQSCLGFSSRKMLLKEQKVSFDPNWRVAFVVCLWKLMWVYIEMPWIFIIHQNSFYVGWFNSYFTDFWWSNESVSKDYYIYILIHNLIFLTVYFFRVSGSWQANKSFGHLIWCHSSRKDSQQLQWRCFAAYHDLLPRVVCGSEEK